MAFFTDNQAIAGNYARDKQDTSIAYEDEDYRDYHQQFRVKLPNGLDIPFKSYWGYMPFSERSRLAKLAGHIREDWEGDGSFIVDKENNSGSGGFDMNLREARGNAFAALVEEWLNSGNLFNEEARFLEVLELLNLPIKPYYRDPDYREEKVYACFMNIANPFRTSRLTKKIVTSLRAASKKAKMPENMQADLWDKNSRSPEKWMESLEEDYANGTDLSWTSIPDWVTDWMRKKGYDGIVDRGGKHHDIGHTVYIPFDSVQVKSATDNRGTFDPQNPNITMALDLDYGMGAMQLVAGRSAQEEMFMKMQRSIERAAQQWRAPFKGTHNEREMARGSTIALAMGIYRRLPKGVYGAAFYNEVKHLRKLMAETREQRDARMNKNWA